MNFSPHSFKHLPIFLASLVMAFCGSCASIGKPSAGVPLSRSSKVLMIGDSLTVGPFGDQIESWLQQNLGPSRVAVYAACGSSPEHWLAADKDFISPCGYRETTETSSIGESRRKGQRSVRVRTPKIENLLAKHRPQIVIVQLGTNHYDSLVKGGKGVLPQLTMDYERFAKALTPPGGSARMVVWITPPDSSKFPKWVEDAVDQLIISTNRRHSFGSIVSRGFTRYVPGVSGSDGVHYNDAAAAAWAAPVIRRLDATFTKYRVKN